MESSLKIVGHRSLSCHRHRAATAHCGLVLQCSQLRLSLFSLASRRTVESEPTVLSWKSVGVPSSAVPAALGAPSSRPRCGRITLAAQKRSFRGVVRTALRSSAVSPAPTLVPTPLAVPRHRPKPNPAVDPVPFGHWTLRDEAAQRRSPLRSASCRGA